MDINEQLQPIVASLIDTLKVSLEKELRDKVTEEVVNKIASTELTAVINDIVKEQITQRINKYNLEATTKDQVSQLTSQIVSQASSGLAAAATKQVTESISNQVANMDIQSVIHTIVESKLSSMISLGSFPQGSIPYTSLNFKGFAITGDYVKGGIIEQFGSTGIEDRATHVQLTLLDHASVFEGPVWAPELQVKGSATIDGNLIIKGTIPSDSPAFTDIVLAASEHVKANLNDELFESFSHIIHKIQRESGIDLDKITQGGREIVKGAQLGYHIVDTNIQRLGIVRDLQTTGENLLTNTLYVTTQRVGINTMDPSATFVVWDEEVEIITAKRKQETGFIGTHRRQPLILGSNNGDNIILHPDGTVQVENLLVGRMPMSSSRNVPNYEGQLGQIVWNEGPSSGGPIGWVCLGNTRWAKFGTIE